MDVDHDITVEDILKCFTIWVWSLKPALIDVIEMHFQENVTGKVGIDNGQMEIHVLHS